MITRSSLKMGCSKNFLIKFHTLSVKNERIVDGPTPYEIRQLAWQMFCIPEADYAAWVWGGSWTWAWACVRSPC